MKTFLRVLVIGAILIILVFLSIGIVRVVPKALSSLASATVSLGSIFGGPNNGSNNGSNNDTTSGTAGANQAQTNTSGTVVTGNGFIISSSTSSTAQSGTSTSTSLTDIITAKFGSYGQNNYVPTPGTNTSSYNYSTGAYSNTTKTSGTSGTSVSTGGVQTASTASACASTGSSNLAVEVLSKGIIDKTTGQFIATNSFSTNDIVSVKFKVENRGACPTGTWNIRVQMPSSNTSDQLKVLNNNASIPGGSALVGQANFDSPTVGNTAFTVSVTDNSGKDSNLNDNTSSVTLSVINNTGGTGSTGGDVVVIGDGRADLAIRILQVGTLNYNNVFIPQSNTSVFRTSDRLAVRFEVINQGRTSTGPWTLRAEMSGYPGQQYQNTQYENAIASGGKATYTIGFNNPQIGSNYITIYADNLNQVNEFDEGNNVGTANFYVSY